LAATLDAGPPGVELVLVNNASTDDTAAVIASFIGEHPTIRVRSVFAEMKGLSAARNAGLRAAIGDVLAFTDDDCELGADYLPVLMRLYAADTKPTMRGGRVLLGDDRDLPFTIKTETTPARYTGRYPGGFIHGCNMSFSRSVLDAVGLFDERFGAGALFPSADDSDYIHRAYKAGADVLFCPELVVLHYHGRRDLADVKRLFAGYMVGDGALFAKHWNNGLWRCLAGNVGNAVKSVWRKELVFEPQLGFSYADAARGNLQGFIGYCRNSMKAAA
jgi:GT2 family glycosyltransferase